MIQYSAAVVFFTSGAKRLMPLKRPKNQVWIFFTLEPPFGLSKHYVSLPPNAMNWSMGYRLDSDIPVTYGHLKLNTDQTARDYTAIFRRKTKWAAWIVSNCNARSLRTKFVKKIKEHGFPVDIYGKCGKPLNGDPRRLISNEYKFYLSFENSMCSDYISEKFFKYFSYDTILVVRGGANYKKLLAKNIFIDTADFRSFKELVQYLYRIGNNMTLYTEYLRRKDTYISIGHSRFTATPYCNLCEKLNNLEKYKRVYRTIPNYLDTCYTPNDIHTLDKP